MLNDWDFARYRGDYQDERSLRDSYQIDQHLELYREQEIARNQALEQAVLSRGLPVDSQISPRLTGLTKELQKALEIDVPTDLYCLPDPAISCVALGEDQDAGSGVTLGISSGAIREMSDPELKALLGHEFAHLRYHNHRYDALLSHDPDNPARTILPPLGEGLYLRWRAKTEITADRLGLLACGNLGYAVRALLRAQYGIEEDDLGLPNGSLIKRNVALPVPTSPVESGAVSHPPLQLRLEALELFSRSQKARDYGLPPTEGTPLDDRALEDAVDRLFHEASRQPRGPIQRAMMRVTVLAGSELLSADGRVSDAEVRVLMEVLHRYFTDEPENEIVSDPGEVHRLLPEQIVILKTKASRSQKSLVLSALADIAVADGTVDALESRVLQNLAEVLGFSPEYAHKILVEKSQLSGPMGDTRLARVSERLRRSLAERMAKLTQSPGV